MIYIKNLKIFNCSINESFHWSKLPKMKELMSKKRLYFYSSADLRYANLRYADLSYADLRYADLSYADLSYADLRYAELRYAELKSIDDKEIVIQDHMSVQGLGSNNRQTHIFKTNIGIVLICGCFYGTEKAFRKAIKETHKGNQYAKEYMAMLKLAKIRFEREN